ncbi:MAG: MBL fold metallo-hydrolase [Planctomycetes bacterium]|nr:MBL fold metallo-hydrolase [Planctomycetota bacterium]
MFRFIPVLVLVLLTGIGIAMAAEYQKKTIGDMEVIALLDIRNEGNPDLLIGLTQAQADQYLKPRALENSINAFAVRKNGRIFLFDTGLGKSGARKGGTLESLVQAGIKPEDVDVVLITHFHGDHIGGLLENGKPVFSKARLLVPRLELESRGGAEKVDFYQAYGDRAGTFEFGETSYPGIVALEATGHTPGHTVFRLESGSGRLLILGDLVHFGNVQLPLPEIAVTYDSNPNQAILDRKKYFAMAAEENLPVAGMHLPFPGWGWLKKDGTGYEFRPLE